MFSVSSPNPNPRPHPHPDPLPLPLTPTPTPIGIASRIEAVEQGIDFRADPYRTCAT